MHEQDLIPHLFRTEYRKITAVLCRLFGTAHIEIAEDIASDTFLSAFETWSFNGTPQNPKAWLYTVAKNKARNYFRRDTTFRQKIKTEIIKELAENELPKIDLSEKNLQTASSGCCLYFVTLLCLLKRK